MLSNEFVSKNSRAIVLISSVMMILLYRFNKREWKPIGSDTFFGGPLNLLFFLIPIILIAVTYSKSNNKTAAIQKGEIRKYALILYIVLYASFLSSFPEIIKLLRSDRRTLHIVRFLLISSIPLFLAVINLIVIKRQIAEFKTMPEEAFIVECKPKINEASTVTQTMTSTEQKANAPQIAVCPKCGSLIKKEHKYCSACGEPFSVEK